mmetsp:Transcript_961/g.1549  ORF Transcript_961/g.1549 Transcript_961/m.1549 type:complete len:104 (+) Transcript_961:2-313(+)
MAQALWWAKQCFLGRAPCARAHHLFSAMAEASANAPDEDDVDRAEAMEILMEISTLLNTGLDKETLSALVGLCELGANPEALAEAVKELRREAGRLQEEEAAG